MRRRAVTVVVKLWNGLGRAAGVYYYHFHIRQLPLPVGFTSKRLAGSRIFVM